MKGYPKIDGITPRKLHEITNQRDKLDSVFCEKALYRFGRNNFVIIKPDYTNTSRERVDKTSVKWIVESGQSVECKDREDGPFDSVVEAVDFVEKSLV